jgi:membrane protease subunit (stomatin/prohibitin family)
MPRYEVRNDGVGPYAAFYCDKCDREFRSQPNVAGTIAQDVGRKVMGDALRNIPLFGRAVAENVTGQDPRYITSLTPQQLEAAWQQVQEHFHECPTCRMIVCPSDYDAQSGYCTEDSPRRGEIAQAQAEQAAGVVKGLVSAFGLGDALHSVGQAAKSAAAGAARCPKDGTLAAPGTKFCPECGSPMVQPATDACPKCGAEVKGAKFCPECGTRIERVAAGVCPNCGAEAKGAKFCPECGTKVA